jgi:hypothetical protein
VARDAVDADVLGPAELPDDRRDVGMQEEQGSNGDRAEEHGRQQPRGDGGRVRDQRPVDRHDHQDLDQAILLEGQEARDRRGAASDQLEADEELGGHVQQRQGQKQSVLDGPELLALQRRGARQQADDGRRE